MKSATRSILLHALALYFTSVLIAGLVIHGSWETYIIASLIISIIAALLKPVLAIILMPFNLITFGFFSSIITLIGLVILTHIFPAVRVSSFQFNGGVILGIPLPSFYASVFLSYALVSVIIFTIVRLGRWITE